ncbi:MAG: hypothetical protein H5T61_01765 [Thermoflexales bacterium]|nr:hypothetical protein [Thermoflexales bacterium]
MTATTSSNVIMTMQTPSREVAKVAEAALTWALEFCAQKMALGNSDAVVDCLRRGDSHVYGYFQYGLAKKVAECLGELDEGIKAVYLYEEEATPEDAALGTAKRLPLTHLIIRTHQKTAALNSLLTGLDRALAEMLGRLLGYPQFSHALDCQVVEDIEVESRTGFGALLSSLHHRPLEVWKRA